MFIDAENNSSETLNNVFKLKNLRVVNSQNAICSYLNIHSLRNRLSDLTKLVFEHIDILIVEQTKLDASFTTAQFWIPGCHKLFRLDITANTGGLLVYVKRSTPTKERRTYEPLFDIQAISFEINLKKEKFFIGVYKPPSHSSEYCICFTRFFFNAL